MDTIVESSRRTLSIVTWKDIRDEFKAANPELAAIIDEIDPSDEYKFVQAEYLYGDLVIDKGTAQLPTTKGALSHIYETTVNKAVQEELSYNDMPLFITLAKDNEVFIDTGVRTIPLNAFHKGHLAGGYEAMDFMTGRKANPIWSYSAGARTILMLPKITDRLGLKRLRARFHIPATVQVKSLNEHWELFKAMAQDENFSQPWKNKVLFFGIKWLTNKNHSRSWQKFKDYLLREIWGQAHFIIDKMSFNVEWETFAEAIALRRLQPSNYLVDHMRHILAIGKSNFPAFKPIDDSQNAAPTNGLQDAFIETYSLKNYLPTFLCVSQLEDPLHNLTPVYYSFAYPTILEGSPIKKSSSTIMLDLREIKILVETLKKYCAEKPSLGTRSLLNGIELDYFHVEHDIYGEIKKSEEIVKEDNAFYSNTKRFPNRTLCTTSPFFNGCIKVSLKK